MINEKISLKKIENLNDLRLIVDFCTKKYGNIISIEMISYNNLYNKFWSIDELFKSYNNDQLLSIICIRLSIISNDGKALGIDIDKKNNLLYVKEYSKEMNSQKNILTNLKNDYDISYDPNYTYYKFDNGVIVKYDNDESTYYKLDENNVWVNDNSVIRWFGDSEHTYEIYNKRLK